MRSIVFFLVLGIMAFGALPVARAEPPLRVATEIGYPPFVFLDKQNSLTGFNVDLIKALCDEIKRNCEISAIPFDQIISGILEGDFDLAVAGMEKSPERLAQVDFTDSYFRSHSIFLEKPGTIRTLSAEALKDKKIGTQSGTIQEMYLNEEYRGIITVVLYRTFEELLQALRDDQVDAVLVDGLPAYAYLKSEEGADLEPLGNAIKSSLLVGPSHIVVSKKLPELTRQINKALETLRASGAYGRINRKYFDFDIY